MDTITVLVLAALGLYCIIAIVNSCRKAPEEKKERQQKSSRMSPEEQKEQQKMKEEANARYNRTVQQRFKC